MVKKLLSITALMFIAFNINVVAQTVSAKNIDFSKIMPKKASMVTSKIEPSDGEFWWGYFNGDYMSTEVLGMGQQSEIPQPYDAALCIPAGSEIGKDKTITGICFNFVSVQHVDDVKIWISTNLPNTPEEATVCCQSVTDLTDFNHESENNVRFDKPYKIDNTKDTYIGYSFKITKNEGQFDGWPILITGSKSVTHKKGLFINCMGADATWIDYYNYGYGDLAIKLLMKGDFDNDAVSINEHFDDITALGDEEVSIPVEVENVGGNGFTSLDLIVDVEGVKNNVRIEPKNKITGVGTKYNFNLNIKASKKAAANAVKITVDKVNGKPNNSALKECDGNIIMVSKLVKHNVLFEEFTATWCAFCPRGFVGMEKCRETFGDDVVLISVHYQDEMACGDYESFITDNRLAFPTANIDRTFMAVDPYFGSQNTRFGIGDDIRCAAEKLPVAEINADFVIDGTNLTAKSDVKFLYTGAANYSLAYVLVHDGIYNKDWWQGNGFSGVKGYEYEPLFEKWTSGDRHMYGIVFDDVAIAAKGIKKGIGGSVPANVNVGESNVYEETFDLSKYITIQDYSKLKLCVLLFDNSNGRIVNSACVPFAKSTAGIDGVSSNDENSVEVARYTVNGCKISAPQKGVNIIKYSDGKVKKVIVK